LPSALADGFYKLLHFLASCPSGQAGSHISISNYYTPKSKDFYGIVDFYAADSEPTTARDGSGSLPKLSRG
jgi:hypothetical protein